MSQAIRHDYVKVIYQNTQRVFMAHAANPCDAITMAMDMMLMEGIDLDCTGQMAIVAKPDDAANGYMARFDKDQFINHDYQVMPCAA